MTYRAHMLSICALVLASLGNPAWTRGHENERERDRVELLDLNGDLHTHDPALIHDSRGGVLSEQGVMFGPGGESMEEPSLANSTDATGIAPFDMVLCSSWVGSLIAARKWDGLAGRPVPSALECYCGGLSTEAAGRRTCCGGFVMDAAGCTL